MFKKRNQFVESEKFYCLMDQFLLKKKISNAFSVCGYENEKETLWFFQKQALFRFVNFMVLEWTHRMLFLIPCVFLIFIYRWWTCIIFTIRPTSCSVQLANNSWANRLRKSNRRFFRLWRDIWEPFWVSGENWFILCKECLLRTY